MLKLENFAKQLFMDYAYRKTGVHPDWRLLNPERKLAWMQEVTEVFDACLKNINDTLALPPSIGLPAASYEKGFLAGQVMENKRLQVRLEGIMNDLEKQKAAFVRSYADS